MRLVISSDRPLRKMADQRVVRDLKLGEINAGPLLLLGVDLRLSGIRNKVRFPNPLPVVGRQIALVAGLEIIRFPVVAIHKRKITVENESFIVKRSEERRVGKEG